MAAKKTIRIADLKEDTNGFLVNEGKWLTDDIRAGACGVLEHALHLAQSYKGFMYVDGWPKAQELGTEHKRFYY